MGSQVLEVDHWIVKFGLTEKVLFAMARFGMIMGIIVGVLMPIMSGSTAGILVRTMIFTEILRTTTMALCVTPKARLKKLGV